MEAILFVTVLPIALTAFIFFWTRRAYPRLNTKDFEYTFKCIGCGQSLSLSSYYKKNNKRGHDCRCKDCRTGLQNSKRQLMATEGKWQF